MKIYTGSGDRGKTSLFSGERVMKTHPRIDLGGEIDELNSTLGALAAHLPSGYEEGMGELKRIQSYLLQMGALLSATSDSPAFLAIDPLTPSHIVFLEEAIDRIDRQLPQLKSFILPGGHPSAAWAHVARSVCRRVERKTVQLISTIDREPRPQELDIMLVFLNRLSDYLFVVARRCNQLMNVSESIWEK